MENSVSILIPCHNDCAKAITLKEKIKEQFPEFPIYILHNGCRDFPSRFNFANKAKAINSSIKYIKTEYVIVFDADIELSPFCIPAFLNAIENGIDIGTSQVVFLDKNRNVNIIVNTPKFNGAAWICKREILEQYPLPEDIVVEDTAYYYILYEDGIEMKLISDAICTTESYDDDKKSSFKRDIRYLLGEFQLGIKLKIRHYMIYSIASIFASIASLCIFIFYFYFLYLILEVSKILFVMLSIISLFILHRIGSFKRAVRGTINWLIVLFFVITRKRIW